MENKKGNKADRFRELLLIVLFFSTVNLSAETPEDIIHTSYKDGVFTTECKVWIDASEKVTTSMMDDFIVQFRSDLDRLFTWALKDMNLRGESDEFIVYYLKSSEYNPQTEIIHGKMDVIVPGILTIDDISIDGKMYKKEGSDKKVVVQYDILKATGFIKNADATFTILRENEQSAWCTLDLRVKFGWFFNIFVTQKIYKKNLEWRFEQLAINLKEEAQKRERTSTPNP